MKKNIKEIIIENWAAVFTAIFFIIVLLYFIISKENIYLTIFDNLDSNISMFKMLKDFHLYWVIGEKAPFLGGIDRNYFNSDLKFYSIIHMIFPTLVAIEVGWFIKIGFAIFGFLFLGKTIYGQNVDRNLFIFCGLLYGIIPTFPTSPYSFATLPFLMAIMIRITRKWNWKYGLFLFLYPIFSDFSCFGLFICGFTLVFFIIDLIVEKKPAWRFLVSICILSVGYVINEWRLFYIMLFSKEETIRSSFAGASYGIELVLSSFKEAFLYGQAHSGSAHTYVVLPICLLYFMYLNFSYIKVKNWKGLIKDPFNWIMLWQVINCIIYALDIAGWMDTIVGIVIPVLKGFSFSRTLWFCPFLWYFALAIILSRLAWKNYLKLIVCLVVLLSICANPKGYNHIFWNSYITVTNILGDDWFIKHKGHEPTKFLSYGDFYSTELFDEIKEDIGYNGEWSIAYGLYPSVLNYNDIATLDGYLSYYSMDYKEQFRKLIAPELTVDSSNQQYFDTYGGRAYIFSPNFELSSYRNFEVTEDDMLIDTEVFREMGGKYVFSRVKVLNSDVLDLDLLGVYSNEKSPYTIYAYKLK